MTWAGKSLHRKAGVSLLLACAAVGTAAAQQGVQATTVEAALPEAVAYGPTGNLYIALRNAHVVRQIDQYGFITTIAGTGEQGFGGDGGPATSALLDSPEGVAVDSEGTVYIADTHNHRIRKVANGIITTVVGTGVPGFSGDGNGNPNGAQLNMPTALSVDAAGNLYIADTNNHRIRKVAGVITTIAGNGEQGFSGDGQSALNAALDSPTGLVVDPLNPTRFYIGDSHNQRVRMVDVNGVINTLAGNGTAAFGGDGAAAVAAALANPRGLSLDSSSNLYIADSGNQRIRMISGGAMSTIAGDGEQGFAGDLGAATSAILDTPRAVVVRNDRTIAIADTHNQRVRAVTASIIDTIAGIPPAQTEGIALSGPTAGVYGTSAGSLTATFTSPTGSATGSMVLNVAGKPAVTAQVNGNKASFDLGFLSGGLQPLTVSYAGDANNAPIVSGLYLVNIVPANQTITFAPLQTPVTYAPGLSVPLSATSSVGLPVTFSATGPATVNGSTLTYTGAGNVVVSATQGGNADYSAALVRQNVTVLAAQQTITFQPLQSPIAYTPGLAVNLSATASSGLPVTFTATGPAVVSGSTLTYTGPGSVVVTAQQAGNTNYQPVSLSQTVSVVPSPITITSVSPNTVALGTTGQQITVTGTGLTPTSVIRFNGVAAATTPVGANGVVTQLTAVLPQPLSLNAVPVTVYDPASQFSSGPFSLTITPSKANATINVPANTTSGQQPTVSVTLPAAYPVALTGVYTLNFVPAANGVDDPAIEFMNGKRSFPFTIPANSTTAPTAQFQTGTVAGTITVSFTLSANGTDVTPATGASSVVAIPAQVPTASNVTFTQNGPTVTVTVLGFSNVRNMSQAIFNFTPAAGTSLAETSLTIPVTTIFNNWFSSAASNAFGSEFTYTQTFNLGDANAKIQSVSVTLSNSVGAGAAVSTP